jgi:transposase
MAQRAEETAVNGIKDIIIVNDYHSKNIEFRWFNADTGEERLGNYPTSRAGILRHVEAAVGEVAPGGRVVWIMESTTGWSRVKDLIGSRVKFMLANVLQLPRSPKAHRRKTDRLDTARLLREYLNGSFPASFQPDAWWRQVRRVVDCRQDLVHRQTALKNWIVSLLHHETWLDRENLWSVVGRRRLAGMDLPASDRQLVNLKVEELDLLAGRIAAVEKRMQEIYDQWPQAQWIDAVRGIGMVTAVSLLAHIGPIKRFKTAEDLIAYAGLAPGLRQSDQTSHNGKIGGGGTDVLLRYLLIEAGPHLAKIPRYQEAHQRAVKKRGKNVAKLVLARMLLRSLHKMLRDGVKFNIAPEAARIAACPV